MVKQKKVILLSALMTLALCLALFFGIVFSGNTAVEAETKDTAKLISLDEAETVEIIGADGSDYALIFASDARQNDQTVASELSNKVRKASGVIIRAKSDVTKETELEILIGDTDRDFSKMLLEAINAYGSVDEFFVWGYAYRDGKLAYTANSDIAFSLGAEEVLSLVAEDGTLSVPSDLWVIGAKSVEEYEEEKRAEEEAKREEYLNSLIEMNDAFTDDQFNTDLYTPGQFYKPMIDEDGNGYFTATKNGEPWVYPAKGEHPRYLLTEQNIPKILAILEEGKNPDSDYFVMANTFWELANTDMESIHYGEFQNQYKNTGGNSWLDPTGEPYRYDGKTLGIIDAKAMAYMLTGDVKYAYEAIVAIKNAMLSLHYTTDLHMDVYHGPSHVMVTLAAVYDWCYDVLTEEDKWQMIWGTAQILGPQMESGMRYPPSGMQGVNGHGTGPQLARDWMTVATVFSDEVPDWYRYVAGRYFNEYLPVANEQFKNGWVSQGTACYAPIKIHVQAWANYLIKTSTGENFLTEDAVKTMYFFISHITPRETANAHQQYYFQTGDGSRNTGGTQVACAEYFMIAALYNDPVIYAQAKLITANHSKFNYDTIFTMTPSFQLALTSAVDYNGESSRDGIDTIQYFADPAGQMTIREEWGNPDSIAVLMRLMNKTMANHEGYDHGTFQIYYKGLLAGTSGAYQKYGSAAHYYYQQATISSNGLLVFNPAGADAEPKYQADGVTLSNTARYYYSGSQRRANVGTSSVEAWLDSAQMVDTIGAAYGYDSDGRAKYAYLAGDMTSAYEVGTVDYISRKMFTLFTGDEDFPALFFTFDQITSDDASFTKHWLLHTLKEPEIDQDNLTATVINGEGKMYLQSLFGADAIMKVGGEGKAWWINGYFKDPTDRGSWDVKTQSFKDENDKGSWVEGKNAVDGFATDDNYKNIWGRIELRTEGDKYSKFLNVLAVTDTENETPFEIQKFANDESTVYGAQFKNSVIAFLNSDEKPAEKQYKEFSFTTEGTGLYEYYIAGLEAGTWQIIVDGVSVAYSLADTEGALLTFTAPAGDVEVRPGSDVIGANGGKIQYTTGGGVLPKDTLYVYKNEFDFPLPTEVTRGADVFVGWYTSPTYEPETAVTAIPAGTTGTYRVYAKWISNFLNEDYSESSFKAIEANVSAGGVNYSGSTKTGSSFITKTDEKGRNYVEWIEGTKDPLITQTSSVKNFSMLGSDDKCVSFTYQLATNPGNTPMQTHVRLIAKKDVDGGTISSTSTYLFTTDNDGVVRSHKGSTIATLSEEVTTIRIVIDFKNGEMRYYDDDYNIITADPFSPPATTKAENTEEFLKCLTEYLWYFYGGSPANVTDAAMRIYGIRVQEGDEFTALAKPQTEGIKYNLNGGKLPAGAPKDFNSDGTMTLLPAAKDMILAGSVFGGWYTTPTFDEGTETTYAPAGTEGLYEVWAKWNAVFVDVNFGNYDIDHAESNKSYGGVNLNGGGKVGSSFKTETGADGKKYLVWTPGVSDPLINAMNDTTNVSTMNDTSVSYTLTFSKHGSADLPDFEFRLIGKHTVAGETGKGDSNITFGNISNGSFRIGSTTVATIGDEPTTVRIVIDFAEGNIKAYDEWGAVIATQPLPNIPAASGATNYLEWKQCFRSYLFYTRRTGGSADKADQAIRYYSIKIEEGNAFALKGNEQPPKPNSIIYETNGGTLPEDAPTEYDVALGTVLPTNVTKSGYIFGGWYTSADFTGERMDAIPFGGQNPVKVYAKWLYIVMDEDWNDKDFVHPESLNTNRDGIIYNTGGATEPKPGTGYETVKDESGNTYLKVFSPSHTVYLVANNSGQYQFPEFKETAVTFEFSYGRDGDNYLASNYVRLQTSGSKFGNYQFLSIDGDTGNATLKGSAAPFVTIGSEMVTFRITIDFAALTVTAYGEDAEVLDVAPLGAVPTSAAGQYQPTTWVEWMDYATGYYVYNQLQKPAGFTAEEGKVFGARFDNFKVIDGNPYINFSSELPKSNSIKYEANGGILPTDAPTEYDPAVDTALPTPEKSGSAFGGWYTTSTFEEGTRVEKIAAGTDGMLRLYAKWLYVFVDEDFESKDFEASANTSYNKVNLNLQKEGTTAKTELDANGNKYLRVFATTGDAIVMVTNSSYNLTHMTETKLSIKFDLLPGDITSKLQINIATSGNAYGQLKLATMSGGSFKLIGSSTEIANVNGGRITLRLLVDFAEAKVYAYSEEGDVLDSAALTVPSGKNGTPESVLAWQKVATNYLLYAWMENPQKSIAGTTSSLGFDNMTIAEGMMFYVKPAAPLPDNSIVYETNGGTLPEGAPAEYDTENGTLLPTGVTKDGYIFGGWYTSADFTGERMDYVPVGTEGIVTVYAKWLSTAMSKDFEDEVVNIEFNTNTGKNGFGYNSTSVTAAMPSGNPFTTVTDDESGNTYLKVYTVEKSLYMTVTNSGKAQLKDFNETAITFVFDYGRIGTAPLLSDNIRFETSGSNYGNYNFMTINGSNGNAQLKGSSVAFATVGAEADARITVCVTIDFAACTVTAYSEDGEILDRVPLGAVPTSKSGYTQAQTWVEWQSLASGYLAYHQFGVSAKGVDNYAYFDNFKVIDGNPFIDFATKIPAVNTIDYVTNGGTLPEGAPTEYEPLVETVLPIPEKAGYFFDGWYTTENFEVGTRVEKILTLGEGKFTIYAKWNRVFASTDYENTAYNGTEIGWQASGGVQTLTKADGTTGAQISSVETVTDEEGNKFLKFTVISSDGLIVTKNSSYNLTTMTETAISYTFDIIATGDNLLNAGIRISTDGNAYGQLSIADVNGLTGEVKLAGGSVVIGNVKEGKVTLHVTVDFAEGTATAYDAGGLAIDSSVLTIPDAAAGNEKPATLADWQKVAKTALLYVYMTNPTAGEGVASSLGFDNVSITEGSIFEREMPEAAEPDAGEDPEAGNDGADSGANGEAGNGAAPEEGNGGADSGADGGASDLTDGVN